MRTNNICNYNEPSPAFYLTASDTCNLRGIPIANCLGVTSDSDRIELFRSLNCQRTVVDQSSDPLSILSGSSNNLLDGVNEFWLITSGRCISENRLRKIIGSNEQIVWTVSA